MFYGLAKNTLDYEDITFGFHLFRISFGFGNIYFWIIMYVGLHFGLKRFPSQIVPESNGSIQIRPDSQKHCDLEIQYANGEGFPERKTYWLRE